MKRWDRTRTRHLAIASVALVPYALIVASPSHAQANKVSYGREIAPLFKSRCISCHSGASPAGKLDLSTRAGILKGGASGKLLSGDAKHPLLIARIDGSSKPQMPMGLPALSTEEQVTMKLWVEQGMAFDNATPLKHWAYVAPVAPPIPALNSGWVKNPVDAFVLEKLKSLGLHPSPEASKETLIRRVSLDLTGLPPTPTEVDAFVKDSSPNAYERVVDRLLASPHYGERQAREWLDLARYADSDGYEKDLNRTAWLYRDWVISAYNKNLPYDQFTIKQIAGDLLPNATLDDKIATGFQRNTMFNREGGVDQLEAHFLVELDRAETTSAVWLGSTLNCARCHDHKYDPFTQKDYYKMVAFYNNTAIYPRGPKSIGEEKWFEAELKAPSKTQAAEIQQLSNKVLTLKQEMKKLEDVDPATLSSWEAAVRTPVTWEPLVPAVATSAEKTPLQVRPDQSILATGKTPDNDAYTVEFAPAAQAVDGLRLEALSDPSLPSMGPGRAGNGNFVLSHLLVFDGDKEVKCEFADADYSQDGFPALKSLVGGPKQGWAVNGAEGKSHEMVVKLGETLPAGARLKVVMEFQYEPSKQHVLGAFRVSATSQSHPEAWLLPADLKAAASSGSTSPAQLEKLRSYVASHSASYGSLLLDLTSDQASLDKVNDGVATALVMEEKPHSKPLSEWVRHRGEFESKTEQVLAGTPTVLPPLPAMPSSKVDRLALANWLVSKSNPLTARVEVNRMWEQIFGRGIVTTSEDFGTRGSPPTNQKLLDWLAVRFMNSGWNMKSVNKLIVMSSTYRQSSAATPELLAKDPENLYLARGARFRMEAEMIHDVSLAAGGLLSPKVGGPSVYPYQPAGIWDSPYNDEQWMPSKGDDRYRRGIYTFWKRTAPYPSFIAMDAGTRESCTVRRIRTNTPLQALALLNDNLMLQAAFNLGKRMEKSSISEGFEICTARPPKPAELDRLKKLETKLQTRYSTDARRAAKLGGTAKDAAYTMVANVLLNLDETITKG